MNDVLFFPPLVTVGSNEAQTIFGVTLDPLTVRIKCKAIHTFLSSYNKSFKIYYNIVLYLVPV